MPATTHTPAARQAYDAHRGGNLLSEATSVILLLAPRSMLCAGFNSSGAVLLVRRVEAAAAEPAWSQPFFEQQAMTEPLLGDPGLVKAVFFADEHLLQVPDALYDKAEAEAWTQTLWARGTGERVLHCTANGDVHLLTAVAQPVTLLMERFFANAELMPLAIAHLYHAGPGKASAQCTVTDDLATATLHTDGELLWQGTFPCTAPEDAGYQILTACAAHGISAQSLSVCATADAPYQIGLLQDLKPYLPNLRTASDNVVTHDPDWAPVLTLLYQLRSCAS